MSDKSEEFHGVNRKIGNEKSPSNNKGKNSILDSFLFATAVTAAAPVTSDNNMNDNMNDKRNNEKTTTIKSTLTPTKTSTPARTELPSQVLTAITPKYFQAGAEAIRVEVLTTPHTAEVESINNSLEKQGKDLSLTKSAIKSNLKYSKFESAVESEKKRKRIVGFSFEDTVISLFNDDNRDIRENKDEIKTGNQIHEEGQGQGHVLIPQERGQLEGKTFVNRGAQGTEQSVEGERPFRRKKVVGCSCKGEECIHFKGSKTRISTIKSSSVTVSDCVRSSADDLHNTGDLKISYYVDNPYRTNNIYYTDNILQLNY